MVFSVVTFSVVNRQADFTHVFATKLLLAIFVRTVATTWTIKQDIFFRIETVAFFSFVFLTFYPCIGYFFFPNSGLRLMLSLSWILASTAALLLCMFHCIGPAFVSRKRDCVSFLF